MKRRGVSLSPELRLAILAWFKAIDGAAPHRKRSLVLGTKVWIDGFCVGYRQGRKGAQ